MNPIEELLNLPPFGIGPEKKSRIFSKAFQSAFQHHWQNNQEFRKICQNLGFTLEKPVNDLAEYPYLPAGLFKNKNLVSVPKKNIKSQLYSSATSGAPSIIHVDHITTRRQIQASTKVIAEYIGTHRRPFLILDEDPTLRRSPEITARSAATRGFLIFASSAEYFLAEQDNNLTLDKAALIQRLDVCEKKQIEICIFGFTYILYTHLIKPLLKEKYLFTLSGRSKVIHIGGWKKLENQKVSRSKFLKDVGSALGIPPSNVLDFYGFTEQMGLVYGSRADEPKSVPLYSEILIRDFSSLKPSKDGEIGLVQFLTPVPHSYPGISILTDDIGRIVRRGKARKDRYGTQFEILGRAKKAEIRGCGDILGELMEAE